MKIVLTILAAVLLAGCVPNVRDLAADPNTPHMALHFDKDWRTTYQAINAAATQCTVPAIQASEDSATSTGTVAAVFAGFDRVLYVITTRPDAAGTGSDVTVMMPMHEARQRRTWPQVLDLWVNKNDRPTCPTDVWRR